MDEAITGYRKTISLFREVVADPTADRNSRLRFDHPWFGPMAARRWASFVPFHQEIHIRQAAAILERLR